MAETDVAAQDGCAAEVHLPRLQDDGLMERKTMKFVVLPKKDTEQDGFPRNSHFLPHFVGTAFLPVTHSHHIRVFAKAPLLLFYDQNRTRCQLNDPVGTTSKHSFIQRRVARGTNHQEVGAEFTREIDDTSHGMTDQHMG